MFISKDKEVQKEVIHYSLIEIEKYLLLHFKRDFKDFTFSEKRRIVKLHQGIARFELLLGRSKLELEELLSKT